MTITFTDQGWDDYTHWADNDRRLVKRINALIKDCLRDPYSGIGKPEPLKYALSGLWSRRITDEHRLVYEVLDGALVIHQARYHY